MTINWFSPVPPTPSSIALDTAAVLPTLAERARIVVWTHESSWSPALEQHAEVRRYDPDAIPWGKINAADISIYHLGNHAAHHGPIWRVSRQHPGIVVLHDFNLQYFFATLTTETRDLSPSEYLEMMEFHHPARGRELGEAVLSGIIGADKIREACPLTGGAIENALGVALHTREGCSQLANTPELPVSYVPLVALPLTSSTTTRELGGEKAKSSARPYRIIIFGFLGLNRRLRSVLQALHQFPQRNQFHLDIYGTVPHEETLPALVDTLGLNSLVTFHGYASEAELEDALDRSDLAINLRDPTMGEASASQLRIWKHGLPSLVTDTGWYASLPKNTVAPVRRDAELEDIHAHLRGFLTTPEHYRELGRNGRIYVEENHSVEAYVNGLMQLIEATVASLPRQAVAWMAGRAGCVMRPWFFDAAAGILLPQLSQTLSDLFAERPSGR